MSFLRSLLFSIPLIVLSTIVMGTISLVASFFDRTGNSQHRLARIWGKSLLAASLIRVRAEGVEKLFPEVDWDEPVSVAVADAVSAAPAGKRDKKAKKKKS